MKKHTISFIIVLISFSSILKAQNTYIQVAAEPDISVYLDGQFKGKTTVEYEGLLIELSSGGTFTIKLLKEGFAAQEDKITVNTGDVFMYTVKPFTPRVRIRQEGNEKQQTIETKTGNLMIQSVPIGIKISIPKLGINSNKSDDRWYADDIPIGEYDATFSWNNKTYSKTIYIIEGKSTELFINMMNGNIEIRGDSKDEIIEAINKKEIADRIKEQEIEKERLRELERIRQEELARHGSFIDSRDGNEYKTIKIGDQIWMAENLRYLPEVHSGTKKNRRTKEPRYFLAHYKGTDVTEAINQNSTVYEYYGVYYNYYAAKRACPFGFRLPSESDWITLINYVRFENNQPPYANNFPKISGVGYLLEDFDFPLPFYRSHNGYWTITRVRDEYRTIFYPSKAFEDFSLNRSREEPYGYYSVRCIKK